MSKEKSLCVCKVRGVVTRCKCVDCDNEICCSFHCPVTHNRTCYESYNCVKGKGLCETCVEKRLEVVENEED